VNELDNKLKNYLLNFLFNNLKKNYKDLVQSGKEAVSKFELPETQFQKTVRDKITCETHLE